MTSSVGLDRIVAVGVLRIFLGLFFVVDHDENEQKGGAEQPNQREPVMTERTNERSTEKAFGL